MAESELLSTDHRSIRPTRPSPDIDLLVRPISLPREAASMMLYQSIPVPIWREEQSNLL